MLESTLIRRGSVPKPKLFVFMGLGVMTNSSQYPPIVQVMTLPFVPLCYEEMGFILLACDMLMKSIITSTWYT